MPGFRYEESQETDQNKNAKVETRRKHRWRFTTGFLNPGEWIYLKSASRPSFTLETPEMHHDQEVAYFAGKQTFEEMSLEFYDVLNPDLSERLYQWIAGGANGAVTDLADATVNTPSSYKQEVRLEMTDGDGGALDRWRLLGAWPKDTNWNEMDYGDTELQTISVTLRFDRAIKETGTASGQSLGIAGAGL